MGSTSGKILTASQNPINLAILLYNPPHRQEARGRSLKYASTLTRAHFILDSRVKALEGEVRTMKALAMSKDKKQC